MENTAGNGSLDRFGAAVRLAAAMTRPLASFDAASLALDPLAASDLTRIARQATFRRPVEQAILRGHRLDRLDLAVLPSGPDNELALRFLGADIAVLRDAASKLAGATLQRHVLVLTQKADRQRAREILGPEAHAIATQEAPTLFPNLAIPEAQAFLARTMAAPETGRGAIEDYGLFLLYRTVACLSPRLGEIMIHRLPAAARGPGLESVAAVIDAAKARSIIRFLRRRVPAWSAITA